MQRPIRHRNVQIILFVALTLLLLGTMMVMGQQKTTDQVKTEKVSQLMEQIANTEQLTTRERLRSMAQVAQRMTDHVWNETGSARTAQYYAESFSSTQTLHQSGLIDKETYGQQMATLSRNLGRKTEEGMPTETLKDAGINTEKINQLKQEAGELSGQKVAEIARQIAGNGQGQNKKGTDSEEPTRVESPARKSAQKQNRKRKGSESGPPMDIELPPEAADQLKAATGNGRGGVGHSGSPGAGAVPGGGPPSGKGAPSRVGAPSSGSSGGGSHGPPGRSGGGPGKGNGGKNKGKKGN